MVDELIAERSPLVRGWAAAQGWADWLWQRRLRWWHWAAAVGAGLAMLIAFPPVDLWWAAPIGVCLLALATYRRGWRTGAGLGLVAGLTLMVPLLSWAGGFVGPVWLMLPGLEASYIAGMGALAALASPVPTRWRWSWPLVTATLWVAQEALRDRTPWGGFPWGRLAFSQGDSPLLRLAAIGGAPLVTFGVAAVGGLLALAVLVAPRPLTGPAGWLRTDRFGADRRAWLIATGQAWQNTGLAVLAAFAMLLVALLWPTPAADQGRPVIVAVVQGNVPRLGLEFNAQRRAVLDNHVDATLALADQVATHRVPQPDLVVWPENASDIDPLINADANARINQAAVAIKAPILVGGLLEGPGNRVRNVGIVWLPGTGPAQTYVKRHPVPFAEYIPLRRLARLLTDKTDLVRSDFDAGPVPGLLRVGPANAGDVICFEVAYDNVVRDVVTAGADLIVVQTNNATFNAAEARQQLAMVRLRAVEHGRTALMASTVGVSAFVEPDGTVTSATGFDERAVIVRQLRLRTGRSMATDLGALPEVVLVILAAALLVTAAVISRRAKAKT